MKKEFLIPEVEALCLLPREAVATGNPFGGETNDDPALFNLSDTVIDGEVDGGEGGLN